MAIKFGIAVANAMLDQFETTTGASPVLEIRSGAAPTEPADADSGTLLASIPCGADFMAAAASKSKAKNGTWQDTSADGTGTAAHFRLKTSGSVVVLQGTVTATGGGGDLTVDNTSIAAGQQVTITGFAIGLP
jgi:hypothetical protein